jgi:NitT/TauT family transport system permease protein
LSTAGPLDEDGRGHWHLHRLLAQVLPPAVLLGIFAIGWQIVAHHNRFVLPQLGAVWDQLVTYPGEFVDAGAVTLEETAVGLAASFAVAFGLAIAMTYFKVVERAVMPLAVVLSVTPIVALAPAVTISLGVGLAPRFLVTALIVFFPLLVNSLVGLKSTDPEALRYFATLYATRRAVLFRLRIPSSLPFLFTAARICFPLALIGAVVSEWSTAGSENGLGSLIQSADLQSEWATVYAGVVCLSALGLVFTLVVILVERRLLFWHPSRYGAR